MRKLEEINQQLDDAKKKQAEQQSLHAVTVAKLTQKKDAYADRVKHGAGEAELDQLDAELFKIDRERARIEIRLDQSRQEIEQLLAERESAYAEQARNEYSENAKAALVEAREIEVMVQALIGRAGAHAARLAEMRQQAEKLGVLQVPFRLSNLEHRVTAAFRNSSDRTYKQSYETIIAGNIASVEKQMNEKPSTALSLPTGNGATNTESENFPI